MTNQTATEVGSEHELAALAASALQPMEAGSAAATAAPPAVPSEVLIAPWGRVESANGTFVVDDESGRLVVAAFERHGCDLPIDYEHQTLGGTYASPTGQAPAAGWIKRLEVRPGVGLVAHVQWTDPARRQLTAGQYRYLSPVAIVRRSDRKLIELHSAALTNKPAIAGMQPLVHRRPNDFSTGVPEGDDGIDHFDPPPTDDGSAGFGQRGVHDAKRHSACVDSACPCSVSCAVAMDADPRDELDDESAVETDVPDSDSDGVGLPATEVESSGTPENDLDEPARAVLHLRQRLSLQDDCSEGQVLVAAARHLAALEARDQRRRAGRQVEAAVARGRLTPAQRDWAVKLVLRAPALFEEYLRTAPAVLQTGRLDAPRTAASFGGSAPRTTSPATRARAEYRANPLLAGLTSEEAYVAEAMKGNVE